MGSKKLEIMWAVSFLAVAVTAIVLAGSHFIGISLPDAAVRTAGGLELIALPIFVFLTVKRVQRKR